MQYYASNADTHITLTDTQLYEFGQQVKKQIPAANNVKYQLYEIDPLNHRFNFNVNLQPYNLTPGRYKVSLRKLLMVCHISGFTQRTHHTSVLFKIYLNNHMTPPIEFTLSPGYTEVDSTHSIEDYEFDLDIYNQSHTIYIDVNISSILANDDPSPATQNYTNTYAPYFRYSCNMHLVLRETSRRI